MSMRDSKGRFVKGCKINLGKHRSEEQRQQMSLMRKGKNYGQVGENHASWKGGRWVDHKGYVRIWIPEHPFHDIRGYVKEHRLIMEKHLGRYLTKDEDVHHINGDKTDNRIENLELLTHSEHSIHHTRLQNNRIGRNKIDGSNGEPIHGNDK